ncbi:MAG: metal-dependent phosphohydrolase [Treponema sp.]|jgi:response regulator RpfG family c-di-GMP phosphodiesterase|nr:metal-dependent phosphohydrolase [Treponema sp.]
MVAKGSVTLLKKAIEEDRQIVDICLQENIQVICINKDTKKDRHMPFSAMYGNNSAFWMKNDSWEYFLVNDDLKKIKEKIPKEGTIPVVNAESESEELVSEADKAEKGYGDNYVSIAAMTDVQRIQHLQEDKNRLDTLLVQKPRKEELITEALVETTRDAMLHNHATLANAMNLSSEEAKKQTQGLVDSTRELVKSSSQLISADIFNDELMNTLVSKSNGTILQHMTRVYLNGLAFLTYYNKLVSGSSMINKLRISFDKRYREYYHSLLPHIHADDFTLERVFRGGMRIVPENDFYNWATGFLIHDIGKAAAVEYHEGEAAYNREIVMEHVKIGFTSIKNKTNYPLEAAFITGYHHEYYGDPAGYGYYRTYLEEYKKANPQARIGFCIALDINSINRFEALGYFPAKVLEIIDVYDSVTDPNRKYRKAMTPQEALTMMEEEFINKHHKIDIILFDIFTKFVQETIVGK